MDSALAFASAMEVRKLIADGSVSPVELTELFFDRIDARNSRLNAYLTVSHDLALGAARRAEQAVVAGDELGPLHGVPVSIKDLEMTAGVRTTSGSMLFEDRVPEVDSAVVERVRAAGAIILGKTNTPEFGLLGHTQNRLGDHCRNPWNTERTTGGSSGGAGAALAAGLCSLATGSDGGGSIRIPASFCGVYGIKPTQGRVPVYAGAPGPPHENFFSQSGPMSRTVRDSALLLQVLAGHDPRDAGSLKDAPQDYLAAVDGDINGLRMAWSPDFGHAAVDREVVDTASRAARVFEDLGCSVDDAGLVLEEPFEPFWALFSTISAGRYSAMVEGREDSLTDYARECIDYGAQLSGADFSAALGRRVQMRALIAELFERYDVLLSPTTAVPAFPVGDPPGEIAGRQVDPFGGSIPFTYPINMVGHPAASIPCGFTAARLPVGLQITGRWGDEATVIAVSAALERARPWAQRRPPVS